MWEVLFKSESLKNACIKRCLTMKLLERCFLDRLQCPGDANDGVLLGRNVRKPALLHSHRTPVLFQLCRSSINDHLSY